MYLNELDVLPDHSTDSMLTALLPAISPMLGGRLQSPIIMSEYMPQGDTIVVIPFLKPGKGQQPSGFSDLEHHVICINIRQIEDFVSANSLNDTTAIDGYLGLILLHEASHFALQAPGAFDAGELSGLTLAENQMTISKRIELRVDSLAICMLQAHREKDQPRTLTEQMNIQFAIANAAFMLSSKRMIENFGNSHINHLKDHSYTHPNLELRLAFMNYYLQPSEASRILLDEYIYERDVAPLNQQLRDPRIHAQPSENSL